MHECGRMSHNFSRYILLRRTGVANELEAASRNFDPKAIFDDLK